jgi:gas vesicle protein
MTQEEKSMSDESNNHNLMIGAAVVAGILGTLSALLKTNRTVQGWTEHAKDAANDLMDRGDAVNKNLLIGGVAGGLIGATAALLLAPKAGSELIQDIAHTLSHPGELVHSTSRKSSSRSSSSASRKSSRSKSASRRAHGKEESKPEEGSKSRRSSSSRKKSPARRRTATAALKAGTEKVVSETAGSAS